LTSLDRSLVGLSALAIVAGSSVIHSPLFVARWGGTTKDIARSLVVDSKQHVFITGSTYSADFPTTTRREHPNGNWCTFATSLTANSGAVVYSTVACGKGETWGVASALGSDGELWVSGSSDGAGLPVTIDAVQRQFAGYAAPSGAGDAFVFRWSADGQSLRYATYLGGTGDESADVLLSDQQGGVWVGGTTTSRDFPVTSNAFQHTSGGGADGFLARIDNRGRLSFSTYLGGSGNDQITAIDRLDGDRIVLVGHTSSIEKEFGGPGYGHDDGFVAVFDARTNAVMWFRRVGGTRDDHLKSIAVLRGGAIAAGGDSNSANCRHARFRRDGWAIVLSSNGAPLADHCFGGPKIGEVRGLAAAPDGSVWMTGVTATAHERAFVVRFQPLKGIAEYATLFGTEISRGNAITIGSESVVYSTGETTEPWGPLRPQIGGLLEPTKGAFREGQRLGSTDAFVVALR
jgi:hypothetical protein